ncbi:MAG: DUF3429 domain-containing protein [Fluviibacter sp.]
MKNERLPLSVGWLGYGGLIPFLVFGGLSLVEPAHQIIYRGALFTYGAVILSFVGAIQWGLAMCMPELTENQRRNAYLWSVVPALIAWITIFFGPVTSGLLLIFGFLIQYWRDLSLSHQFSLPGWFLPLRLRLTSIACISLGIGVYSVF